MAYRPMYPPWTWAVLGFFLFVVCLACFAGEQFGAALIAGLLAGFFAGAALSKELYRRSPPWLTTVMGDPAWKSTFGTLADVLETKRERDELRRTLVQIENWVGLPPNNRAEAELIFEYIRQACEQALADQNL